MLLEISAAGALSVALFVETTSWWMRGYSAPSQIGLYISRSNIYLYGGRFFTLVFISAISFLIETGAHPSKVVSLLALSFITAALVQVILLNGGRPTASVMRMLNRALFLPDSPAEPIRARFPKNLRLAAVTTLATFFFGMGIGGPLILAALVPEYRLSISNLGQIINSGGMVLLLLFVDQALYRALDRGSLLVDVVDYTYGRIAAFLLVGIICLAATVLGLGHA